MTPTSGILCLLAILVCGVESSVKRENYNMAFDIFLGLWRLGYIDEKIHTEALGDFHGNSSTALGIVLSDVQTLKRVGPATCEVPSVDYLTVYGSVGFGHLQVNVSSLSLAGSPPSPAVLQAGANVMDVRYTLEHKSKRNCVTRWEKFSLRSIDHLTLDAGNGRRDVTAYFNQKVLPEINEHMASPKFLARMGREFDFCVSRYLPF